MADRNEDAPTVSTDAGIRTGWRFSPQVIVFGLTFVAIFYAAKPAVIAFVHAWWSSSFRQVEFVMDEWRPNDGHPYITGQVTGWSEPPPFHLGGAELGGRRTVEGVPALAYEKGVRVPVWWSDRAPLFSYDGARTNANPVAAMPTLPGWGQVLAYALLTLVTAAVGFALTLWVAARFARGGGTLPMRRFNRP